MREGVAFLLFLPLSLALSSLPRVFPFRTAPFAFQDASATIWPKAASLQTAAAARRRWVRKSRPKIAAKFRTGDPVDRTGGDASLLASALANAWRPPHHVQIVQPVRRRLPESSWMEGLPPSGPHVMASCARGRGAGGVALRHLLLSTLAMAFERRLAMAYQENLTPRLGKPFSCVGLLDRAMLQAS